MFIYNLDGYLYLHIVIFSIKIVEIEDKLMEFFGLISLGKIIKNTFFL